MEQIGELGVSLVQMKDDLSETQEALAQDKKFLAELEKTCADRAGVHEEEQKMRAQEIVALADTIRILNDDDALELFKKTLPSSSASFVQLQTTSSALRAQAQAMLAGARARLSPNMARQRIDFISLALRGEKAGFEKVITLIDELVVTLKKEQT